ncbi:hypothetical protein SERLA73DRAFT_181748 [Serpula lacrymans var. lacrymans S7.3]|uniref:N-acetyltransferase domain-containing protein n=2 Tax=Serpula lacrymans var. lacrymans TaxID=341189 RepID=F8PYM0_SERL3|nr:uncharacterized protein SERLADRAFT_468094 [Serpula lacrymans var. lacrymans S7.9]EGN98983.1 hypothetical protein SERLA73DRAFT_181748 [Serpula lacrymans var. lacrymans S7.3]EGO24570.1 hypothetical protein SERLADRAFT_468094 [Serpula lacrymans var. lacrymans S7.9]
MITDAIIVGRKVVLVPYSRKHVEMYHKWMTDPVLQALTASEPLTLEEEYAMQNKWREDNDKLTFIILANQQDVETSAMPMVGDVNLFLKGDPNDEDFEAEVEIMIAEAAYRQQGFACEALQLMLSFATGAASTFSCSPLAPDVPPPPVPLPIKPSFLVVRISQSNAPSIALFRRLGFEVVKTVDVFQEVEMRFVRALD